MKNERADQWIEALESGDYKQTSDMLFRKEEHGFCCLGVLTNEYCESNDVNFAELTGLEGEFANSLECEIQHTFDDIYGDEPSDQVIDNIIQNALNGATDEAMRTTDLNKKVARWVGLRSKVDFDKLKPSSSIVDKKLESSKRSKFGTSNGYYIKVTNFLAKLNDEGVSFNLIAKFLKTNKNVLFTRKA